MKKLVLVLPAIDFGGAQKFCLNFTKYLNSINYPYKVVFLRKGKSEELKQEFLEENINFCELNSKSVLKSIPKLIKCLKLEKPEVIISTVNNVDFAVSLIKIFFKNVKLYLRKANVVFDNQKNFKNKIEIFFQKKFSDGLIALTNEMKNEYEKMGFSREKIFVINNMVDIDYISKKMSIDNNDGFDFFNKDCPILVSNARFVPEKRHDILIKTFEEVKKDFTDAKLLLIGDGPLRDDIKKLISKELEQSVFFLGFQSNPYYYMAKSNLLVLTSDYEGFPNVIIEAFACGIPVVATDCRTGPKEIIDIGKNGFVCPLEDYKELAKAIKCLLNSRNEKMNVDCIEKASKYSIKKISSLYVDLINKKEEV